MGKIVLKTIALAAAFCLLPSVAFAAGLGKLTVLSALGQPLRAEIEIVSLQQNEADSLTARLASPDTFRQSNIELNGALLQVRFAIETRSGGQSPVVTMTSVQPMNEPFFDMLIELSWASGRLVREYTFLLDPPEYNRGTAVAAPVQPVIPPGLQQAPEARVAEAPRPVERPPEVRPLPEQKAAPPAAAPAPAKPQATYEVKRGDTLARIADRNKVDGVSLQQMLVALYRGNAEAFDGGNMNRLRSGKILNLPDRDTALGLSTDEARRLVGAQGAEYNRYRQGLGAAVASAPARADTGRQASGRIGAAAEEKTPAAREPAKDQLKLSKVEDAKAGGKAGASASLDDLAAKEKALKDANERIALLEKNVADMKKLVQLNSQAGAQLQQQASKQAEPAAKAAPAAKQTAPEAAKSAVAPSTPQVAPAAAPAGDAKPAGENAPVPVVATPPVAPPAAPKAAAPKVAVAPPAPAPEPAGFLDELLDNPAALGGAGGVVVLLAGYAFYAVRKKRRAGVGMSEVAGMTAEANSVFGPSGGASIDTSSSQFQSDFVPGEAEKGSAEEIDPIAEADVYMAYGRDAQAEEILKESLAKDPTRQPVRVKLMEIYANRKDVGAFTVLAGALHAATGASGPEWDKAVVLGKAIDPSNPMFGGGSADSAAGVMDTQAMPNPDATLVMSAASLSAAAPAAAAPVAEEQASAPALDFDLDLGATPEAPAQSGVDLDLGSSPERAEQAPAPTTLDFDLDMGSPADAGASPQASNPPPAAEAPAAESAQAPSDLGFSIDFELPTTEGPAAAPAPEQVPVAPTLADTDAPSIDFDLGSPGEDKALATEAPAMDLSSITLDLGSTEASEPPQDAHWQEVATKLDLAKAYQEMGDKDGARELLNEVLKEGDEAQQKQATTMLEAVG